MPDDLEWTDMVYGVGFPKGIRMVTAAMVSNVAISSRRSFHIWMPHLTGDSAAGPCLPIRNDGSGLDWVGHPFGGARRARVLSWCLNRSVMMITTLEVEYEGPCLHTPGVAESIMASPTPSGWSRLKSFLMRTELR
jgi:hypothetical protein